MSTARAPNVTGKGVDAVGWTNQAGQSELAASANKPVSTAHGAFFASKSRIMPTWNTAGLGRKHSSESLGKTNRNCGC